VEPGVRAGIGSGVTTLVYVLGDQLTAALASLRACDPADSIVLMAEVMAECTYVRHHKKKIAFLLSAMRHHAAALRAAGWTVDYVPLDMPDNTGTLTGELKRAVARHRPQRIVTIEAGEWRVLAMQEGWSADTGLPVELLPDDRFFCSRAEFAEHARGRKGLVMEFFYRELRKRTGILMDGGKPVQDRWNFDQDNRKTPPRGLNYPLPPQFEPDLVTAEVIALVADRFPGHFGSLDPWWHAVTRDQALQALDHFIRVSLPRFGDYQDAMIADQDYLYHAVISPYLNAGLLTAREVVAAAQRAWADGEAPINAVEGFVRQILGWREYVRGVYFHAGPDYHERNALNATRPLPDFYWTGDTQMRCMADSVRNTARNAYAHHIQRLMVLGNFAMLAGCSPQEVADWYLVVYADAYEWVEDPNVIGMSQFADGGLLGSKPYAGSGQYINRMSDYCGRCTYDVAKRVGDGACPFNALYWDFLARNEALLRGNQRLRNMYSTWDRFGDSTKADIRAHAAAVLAALRPAHPGWARAAPPQGSSA